MKNYDLEFSVDPLFKKTCADFDEGGAKGLLMNNLKLDQEGLLLFDASEAKLDLHQVVSSDPQAMDTGCGDGVDMSFLQGMVRVRA